jgi:hypothetical protein
VSGGYEREGESFRQRQRRQLREREIRGDIEMAANLTAAGKHHEAAQLEAAATGREYKLPEPTDVDRALALIHDGKVDEVYEISRGFGRKEMHEFMNRIGDAHEDIVDALLLKSSQEKGTLGMRDMDRGEQ